MEFDKNGTMREIIIILNILALTASSCGQVTKQQTKTTNEINEVSFSENITENESSFIENDIDWDSLSYEQISHDFKNFKIYKLNDTIIQDMNGDSIAEKIFFNENKNIIIKDGKTNAKIPFDDDSFNEFDWVNFGGVTTDRETWRMLFKENGDILGDETVYLFYPSIFVRKYESGGGTITFNNEKYVWIHQND